MGIQKERGKEIKGKKAMAFLYSSIKDLKDVVEEKKITFTRKGKAKFLLYGDKCILGNIKRVN